MVSVAMASCTMEVAAAAAASGSTGGGVGAAVRFLSGAEGSLARTGFGAGVIGAFGGSGATEAGAAAGAGVAVGAGVAAEAEAGSGAEGVGVGAEGVVKVSFLFSFSSISFIIHNSCVKIQEILQKFGVFVSLCYDNIYVKKLSDSREPGEGAHDREIPRVGF